MCEPQSELPTGGYVTIEYRPSLSDLFLGYPTELIVTADHYVGSEDWTARLEIRSSDTAIGYYRYPNREGGELRLTRLENNIDIAEYGIPHSDGEPFVRLLRPERNLTNPQSSQSIVTAALPSKNH